MNASLRALLTGLIDYAGLFPPAKLPMPEAVRNYLRFRDEPEAWMLGRFICPAARLHELTAFAEEIGDRPLVVSALGRGGETSEEFSRNLLADLAAIEQTRQGKTRLVIDVLEVRLPTGSLSESRTRILLFADIEEKLRRAGLRLFVEAAVGDPETLIEALKREVLESGVGFKMRCGGLEATAFPSAERLASVVAACLRHEVPFKATAGLHHPLPGLAEGIGARMHGFVNLFAAGVLTGQEEALAAILQDDDPGHFRFDDHGLSWGALSMPVEAIREARTRAMISFGSCSFDEPRDDLRALGWL